MSWFSKLCRNLGLMVHNIRHPGGESERKIIRKEHHQERKGNVTVRRTTIEEIEFEAHEHTGDDPDKRRDD